MGKLLTLKQLKSALINTNSKTAPMNDCNV